MINNKKVLSQLSRAVKVLRLWQRPTGLQCFSSSTMIWLDDSELNKGSPTSGFVTNKC